MNHKRLRHLVWYLIMTRIHVEMAASNEFTVFDKMLDLQELCPYSSFCDHNASSEFPYSDEYKPCCHSCSCKPDCSLRGDCCFTQLGEYGNGENMICRHSFEKETTQVQESVRLILEKSPHYRMVIECDVMAQSSGMSCRQNSSDIHPMFSPTKGFIYINAYCALCNNASDAVPWRKAMTCLSARQPFILPEFIDQFKSITVSDDFSECLPYYIPPIEVDLDGMSCSPRVIRQCNLTDHMTKREHFWDLCELFNATFTIPGVLQSYANVYCFMCNINLSKEFIGEMHCPKQSQGDGYKFPSVSHAGLTILLDSTNSDRNLASTSLDVKGMDICRQNSVMVPSFTQSCRPLKCPTGQLLRDNQCGYYSKTWIGGPFAVMLKLTQLSKDALLPTSFFKNMRKQNKYDNKASWIRRKTLRRWTFVVLYHPSKDQAVVEYVVVKAIYPFKSVDPHNLHKSIARALLDQWEIEYLNTSISFEVSLNEYFYYLKTFRDDLLKFGINITDYFVYAPKQAALCNYATLFNNVTDMLLVPNLDSLLELTDQEMFLSKLFFCKQVELLPEEYEYSDCLSIFFKVKNVTLFTFNTAERTANGSSALHQSVYVCLHEFDQTTNLGIGMGISVYLFGLMLGICMTTVKMINNFTE